MVSKNKHSGEKERSKMKILDLLRSGDENQLRMSHVLNEWLRLRWSLNENKKKPNS